MKSIKITEPILPNAVKSFIDRYIKENSLENVKVTSRPAVSKGNNFMSIIDRVTVSGIKNDTSTENNFIVKTPVSDEALSNVFSVGLFFEREMYMYREVAKLFDEIQQNLSDTEKFKFPKCYLTSFVKFEQCIILEDLLKEDFKPYHRLRRVDFEHASLAMESLGKMHAMSFYVQENMQEKFKCLKEAIYNVIIATFYPDGKLLTLKLHELQFEELLTALDCEVHKEKLKQFMSNFSQNLIAESLPGPYTIITHGDFWIGNMLFKYENDKPIEMRLLDYQMSRFASPILDMVHFITICTDGEFRKLHYDDILEVYYNSLSRHLSHFSIKVSDVYPRRVFYEQLKKHFTYGICVAIISLANATKDEADAVDITESMNDFVNDGQSLNKTSELFKVRANELVRDCVNYGYL